MFCCLTASTARALLCMADAEFGIQVIVEAVVACPEPEQRRNKCPFLLFQAPDDSGQVQHAGLVRAAVRTRGPPGYLPGQSTRPGGRHLGAPTQRAAPRPGGKDRDPAGELHPSW